MNILKKLFFTLTLLLLSLISYEQVADPNVVEMADTLHQNGKIYLVVLVLVTIFAGVLWMLIRIERKLNKLEREQRNKQS